MFSILAPCPPGSGGPSRREWLRVGGLGAFGLSLPTWLGAGTSAAPAATKPRACIFVFLLGGPPQHETWDPKPDAPPEVRGDLGTIQSATPGLRVGESMPLTAKLTGKVAVLRAVQTNDPAHSSSGYYMTTGVPHTPAGVENGKPGAPNDWPSLGAMVRKVWPRATPLPAAVTLPEESANDGNLTWPGQDGGFLGRAADPWLINCDPASPSFAVPGLGLPAEVSSSRLAGRRGLLGESTAGSPGSAKPPAGRLTTLGSGRRSTSSRPRPPGGPSTSPPKTRGSAPGTGIPGSARASCSPAGWSKPGCRSSG